LMTSGGPLDLRPARGAYIDCRAMVP
jgi:hypothetical protein